MLRHLFGPHHCHGGPIEAPFPSLHSLGCYRMEFVPLMVSMVTHDGSNFRAPLGKPATSADHLVAQVFPEYHC
jgi:hypothetical protein